MCVGVCFVRPMRLALGRGEPTPHRASPSRFGGSKWRCHPSRPPPHVAFGNFGDLGNLASCGATWTRPMRPMFTRCEPSSHRASSSRIGRAHVGEVVLATRVVPADQVAPCRLRRFGRRTRPGNGRFLATRAAQPPMPPLVVLVDLGGVGSFDAIWVRSMRTQYVCGEPRSHRASPSRPSRLGDSGGTSRSSPRRSF